MTSALVKLLPCPFCGGKATCNMPQTTVWCVKCGHPSAEVWNTRADALTAQASALAAKEAEIDRLQKLYASRCGYWQDEKDRADALHARLATIRQALEPLQKLGDRWAISHSDLRDLVQALLDAAGEE